MVECPEYADMLFLNSKFLQNLLSRFWPDRITKDDLIDQLDQVLKIPGTTNAWTMPIKARIDMLSTGVRTPIGIKIQGANLEKIEEIGKKDMTGGRKIV